MVDFILIIDLKKILIKLEVVLELKKLDFQNIDFIRTSAFKILKINILTKKIYRQNLCKPKRQITRIRL